MKAIIMAGGAGSRLRPLTCGRPKPIVPIMNKPVMAHIIELLKKYYINNYLDYFVFIVHDMSIFKSKVYIIKKDKIDFVDYDYYAPRGNVIIPDFVNSI